MQFSFDTNLNKIAVMPKRRIAFYKADKSGVLL